MPDPRATARGVTARPPGGVPAPGGASVARPRVGTPAEPRFVVERDDTEVRGHAEDLGPESLAPLDRGRWRPQRELDLHRARVADVAGAACRFIQDCAGRGLTRVLFIHGKGLHSPGGVGVLRDELVRVLVASSVASHVRAFRTAPLGLGGSGALIVELRRER